MAITPLTDLYIDDSYSRLVQTNDARTEFADGLGRSITFGQTPTGSLLLTASAVGNTITFTKGDGSTFPVTVTGGTVTGDYVTTSSFNAFTSSVVTTSSFNAFTSSYNTGSFSGSFTGSLFGTATTASYILQAVSASFATLAQTANTASYVQNAQTASYVLQAVSASFATLAQTSNTASYVVTAQTASYVLQAVSASFATTASYAMNGGGGSNTPAFPFSGSAVITGSLTIIPQLVIGQSFQGGKVAYILTSSDAGYDSNYYKGIIAAEVDASALFWGDDSSTVINGATGLLIGTGQTNTTAIVAAFGSSTAAGYSDLYTTASYSDWYLPSKDELQQLYNNRVAIGGFDNADYYLSSTRGNTTTTAYYLRFDTNAWVVGDRSYDLIFRPVRSFSILKNTLNTLDITGIAVVSGSLNVTNGITGSLQGTASYATTASYVVTAQTASYVLNAVSSSFASTASYVKNAQTASYVLNAQTASYILNAVSSSFASTASYVVTAQTASYVTTSQTASYVLQAVSASYALTASYALNGGGSGTPVAILDEGTQLTPSVTSINFTGAGVAATSAGGNAVTVTINGTSIDTSTFATTGSNIFKGNQTVTGSLFTTGSNTLIGTTTLTGSLNITGSTTQIGNIVITGSLTVTQQISASSFTGSLFGTASWASNVVSSSYASTASYVVTAQTASYVTTAQTASYVLNAVTASYTTTAQTASYVLNAQTASYATTASYVSSNFQYEIHVSQVDGNDTTGDGSLLKPVATITKGLTLVGSQRKTIIVHPGTYTESPSITIQYTTITGPGLIGGNIVIAGTVSTNNGCTISGIKMTNLTITTPAGAGNVNILNCEISGTLTKSSNADYTVLRLCDYGAANITGAGLVAIFGGNPNFTTVNNASANVIIKSAVTIAPVLTAGTLNLVDSVVVAAVTNAFTSAAGTVTTLANSQFLTSSLNNVAPVVLNGFYSILNCVFDKPTSTLVASSGTGGSTNSIDYFQYINADNITTKGLTVTGSLTVSGSSTFTNIGPAVFSGSVISTQGFSGSFSGSLTGTATTASYVLQAVSASYASNGGVTQLLPGINITLSPTNGLGQVTINSTGGGSSFNTATGSYGSFYSTQTQTNVAGTARSMSLNVTDITNGVSISGSTNPFNTYIKTANAGVYNIQFSAQIDKTDSGTDNVYVWVRKNESDLSDTATSVTLVGNSAQYVAAWNFFVNAAANDYFQLMWYSTDANIRLHAEPAVGVVPGIPSLIVTANRVDQFLSNTGSFSGSFTGNLIGTATTASYITSSFFTGTNAALSASYATTASYAANIPSLKASSASVASFSGTPKSSSITFASSFPNNSYAVTVTGEDARSWTIQSKTLAGFTINSNSTVALTGPVYWIATPFN